MRRLISITLPALFLNPVNAQTGLDQEVEELLRQSRVSVETLETDLGRLDPRMLESLDQYSRQLMDAQLYEQAHDVLDQAVQIVRVEEGLYSHGQYEFLLRRIEAYGNQGDWSDARELMDHFDWLVSRPENPIVAELVDSLLTLANLHLWGVASDQRAMQRYHFKRAERLNNLAATAVRGAWGVSDDRLPDIIYRQVLLNYQQAAIVSRGGPAAMSLRRFGNTGLARSRRDAMATFYYAGLRQLNNIRGLYASLDEPDAEAAALAEMYLGDWHVLFNNSDAAISAYRRSGAALLAAGIEQESINRFFSHPKLLPVPVLVSSWEDAIATLDAAPAFSNGADSLQVTARFSFQQWSSQFPHARAPLNDSAAPPDRDDDYALFSFNLAGLEEVSRWYQGRLKKSISAPQNLQILARNFTESIDLSEVADMVQDFRFRPKLIDGVPQSVNATLIYQIAD